MMSDCKKYTVVALGLDDEGNVAHAKNGNFSECNGKVGECGCIHAEANLLSVMKGNIKVAVVTHSPCFSCAKLLIVSGVKAVYFLKEYRNPDGIELLLKNNVKVARLTSAGTLFYRSEER